MNRLTVVLFALAFVSLAAPALFAQDKPAFITDLIGNMEYVEGQVMALEAAVPQDKYDWRPNEGVRSIGEVYRHIAGGNYLILKLMGVEPPAELNFTMDEKKWDSGTKDKAAVSKLLKDSFAHAKASLAKMTEADLGMKVNFFGNEMTKRSAAMVLLSHVHEHLGQSIAYARMNNIVPPWTAAEMAKQAEKEKK